MRVAKSNYVGVFGASWDPERQNWTAGDFTGDGLFGRNSRVRLADIIDGSSNTLAVGERSFRNYAATWVGVDSTDGCSVADNQAVIGTANYPINQRPPTVNNDCDGTGTSNFSSHHSGGANFLLADGAVRFLSESIDFRLKATNGELGLFQELANRNDGEVVDEF